MTPEFACDWPYVECPCAPLTDLSAEEEQEIIDFASFLLWAATGRVYGPCPVSVLPCGDSYTICGICWEPLRECGCRSVPEIRLNGPVDSVTEVVIDGVVLSSDAYRIDDYQWLVRLDGGKWPTRADPLDPDGFRVDYLLGLSPPSGAGLVTAELACEIAKDRCNDDTCRLPRRVRTVTRQGVTVAFDPSMGFGLPMVDMWVETANRPILAGAVLTPDRPPIRRITWTAPSSP